jgi:thiamine biosynthesis lipoprotein
VRLTPRLLLAAVTALALKTACAVEYRASSYVFGTVTQITAVGDDSLRLRKAVGVVLRDFDRMHRELHAWQPGDLVALNQALARGEKQVPTTAEIARLIRDSQSLATRSGNAFNPAIGRLVALWSFHRSQPGGPPPNASAVAQLVSAHPRMSDLRVEGDKITSANPAVQLDFGGYAKGYALDRGAQLLRAYGIASALINIGGNIMALGSHGDRPWRVGLESPRGLAVMATLDLYDGEAVGISGDYRRYYEVEGERYSHIIDPNTGYPVRGVQSATVLVARQPAAGALSDAATKPIFIAGTGSWREAAARMGVSGAMLVDMAGGVHITRDLAVRLRFSDPSQIVDLVP